MESFTLTSEPVYRNGFAVDFLQSFQRKHSEWWKLEVVLIPLTTDGWWRVQLPLAWWFEILYDLVFREASYDLWKRCVKGNLFFETVVNTCKYTSSPYSLFTGEHPSLLLSWRRTGRTAPIRTDSSVGFINDCEPCFWNECWNDPWQMPSMPLLQAGHFQEGIPQILEAETGSEKRMWTATITRWRPGTNHSSFDPSWRCLVMGELEGVDFATWLGSSGWMENGEQVNMSGFEKKVLAKGGRFIPLRYPSPHSDPCLHCYCLQLVWLRIDTVDSF